MAARPARLRRVAPLALAAAAEAVYSAALLLQAHPRPRHAVGGAEAGQEVSLGAGRCTRVSAAHSRHSSKRCSSNNSSSSNMEALPGRVAGAGAADPSFPVANQLAPVAGPPCRPSSFQGAPRSSSNRSSSNSSAAP